jgi:FMN phosphatase YigB (HAD superfamily)
MDIFDRGLCLPLDITMLESTQDIIMEIVRGCFDKKEWGKCMSESKRLKYKKISQDVILIDCFDTIIHRREHPYQVIRRWEKCLKRLYPSLDEKNIYDDRFKLISHAEERIDEVGIDFIYKQMSNQYFELGLLDEREYKAFSEDAKKLELFCEKSTHYVDQNILRLLKNNTDKRIYCVTDTHFSDEDIMSFLEKLGIAHYFTGVFSSASNRATKYRGQLYAVVLDTLKVLGESCIMIGDYYDADIKQAEKYGIATYYLPHKLHQLKLRISNRLRSSVRNETIKGLAHRIYRQSDCYEEYIVIFYVFCFRLFKNVKAQNGKKIVFLAREGHYLKQCFDLYQTLCVPERERLTTDYLKCSRRAICSVQKDKCQPEFFESISLRNYFLSIGFSNNEIERMGLLYDLDKVIEHFSDSDEVRYINRDDELQRLIAERFNSNQSAFEKYVASKIVDENLNLVDVGWTGRMQLGIAELFPSISVNGYYIGIYGNPWNNATIKLNRKGLIFEKITNETKSKYFDILRANTLVYEQLLAAPHGSACFYQYQSDGSVEVNELWEIQEKQLYEGVISEVQNRMTMYLESICCLNFEDLDTERITKEIARIVLKSSLLQTKERRFFMKSLNKGYVQNFQEQKVGIAFDLRQTKISPLRGLKNPELYVRYFAKLGMVLGGVAI